VPSSTVTSKGQITLPKEIRVRLGVKPGDRVAFREGPDGSILVEAETVDLMRLRGRIRPKKAGVTLDAMHDAIRRGATK
jgi:AbrB family looped-hinge helix DNA binding protein